MQKARRYRIKTPTIAICANKGSNVTVPADVIVTISRDLTPGDRLIDVIWNEKDYLMFTQDLRERGEPLD